jgi:hypothetical protein
MKTFSSSPSICGNLHHPRQMLANQSYEGHASLHDDKMAEDLGFSGAPIEGPTHFSQFVPLLHHVFGNAWFETGCISSHYQNMVVEGEEVRAFVGDVDGNACRIWAEKRDGTPVLTGTASIGPNHPPSELDLRIQKLRPPEQLVILSDVTVGMVINEDEPVTMGFDQHMGDMYPFTLNDKLKVITEPCPWYTQEGGNSSPWGKPIIPLEMISVLIYSTSRKNSLPIKGPTVGLFADQEIKLIQGPLFVNHPYRIERELVALSESRRVESTWIRTSLYDGEELVALCMLNSAMLKDSYAPYEQEAAALGKAI